MAAIARGDRTGWAIGLAALWVVCRWLTGFDGLYGQDAHEYLRFATALRAWLLTGTDPGFSHWPPGYPMAAAVVSLLGIPIAASMQFVSFLAWLSAFWFGAEALTRLYPGPRSAAYWALVFSLSPFVMRIALSSMSDMLAIAWGCAFVSFALRWLEDRRAWEFFAAFLCFGGGVATRFSTPIAWGVFAAWLLMEALRKRQGWALCAAVMGAAIPWIGALRRSSLETLALSNAEEWSFANMVARSFTTASGGAHTYTFPNLVASFVPLVNPGFCVLGIALLFKMKRSDFEPAVSRVLVLGWLVFALFLAGMALQNDRHHLASLPIAMWLLFPAFDRWATRFESLARAQALHRIVAAFVICVQLGLLALASRALIAAQRQEVRIAERLQKEAPVTLFSFSFTMALRNRKVPQRVVELWDTAPSGARPGDLVLFAPDLLAPQWRTEPLMRNFEMLRPLIGAAPLEDFGSGWFLYRIERSAGAPTP